MPVQQGPDRFRADLGVRSQQAPHRATCEAGERCEAAGGEPDAGGPAADGPEQVHGRAEFMKHLTGAPIPSTYEVAAVVE